MSAISRLPVQKSSLPLRLLCEKPSIARLFHTDGRANQISTKMPPPPPGPYSGTSTLALVARVAAFTTGLVYGNLKLKYLKAKSHKKAEAKAHH